MDDSVKIEKMSEADLETIMEIESKSFDFPWRKKNSFIQYVERGDAFVVRTSRNVIVGYVLIRRQDDKIVLYKMAIDPDHHRKGYGSSIIKWADKFTSDQGAKRLFLHVRASNCGAIEFYRKMGFEEIGKCNDYYKYAGLLLKEKATIEMHKLCGIVKI